MGDVKKTNRRYSLLERVLRGPICQGCPPTEADHLQVCFFGNVARKPGWKKTNQNRRYSFTNKTDQIEDIQYIFFEVSIMKINSHEYLLFG